MTTQEIVDALNEALDLLHNAGPNRLCINEKSYYDRLHKLYEKCGLHQEEENDEEE